jgi:DNA-binding LacI/PurR family transcriptional regulator
MARTTLNDVARLVGVSAKTVSNVVNSTGWVGEDVRQRVLDAIRELDYRPNLAARYLRQGKSGIVALALPDLRNPYFAELASYFVSAAQAKGRTVLVSQTGGSREVERAITEGEGLPALDALALSPLALTSDDLAQRRSTIPMVLLGEQAQFIESPAITHLVMPNVTAAQAAVQHLIDRGRRRIAVVGIQSKGPNASATLRAEGYHLALAANSFPADPQLAREVTDFSRIEGSRAMQSLIDAGIDFDAVFCFNDSLAFGVLTTLATNRIAVPDDVAVVGYDNVDESALTIPPLTTVEPSPKGIARRLFSLITADELQPGRHFIKHKLVIRESS